MKPTYSTLDQMHLWQSLSCCETYSLCSLNQWDRVTARLDCPLRESLMFCLTSLHQVSLSERLSLKRALWTRWSGNCTKCPHRVCSWHYRLQLWANIHQMWSCGRWADTRCLSSHVLTCKLVCLLVAVVCVSVCFYANQVHMKFISWTNLLVQ